MKEKQNLNNLLFNHMKLNLLAFSIIFILFGLFIFQTVSRITYRSIDEELLNAIDKFKIVELNYNIPVFNFNKDSFRNENPFENFGIINERDYYLSRRINNPKIICLLRDSDYKILNKEDLGRNVQAYFENLSFDVNNLNEIYEIKFDSKYYYRAINLKIDSTSNDNEDRYIQLLIN